MSGLAEWDSFYVIVGGAAGALIGLQFVVMTLITEKPSPRIAEAGPIFSTPTIIHFSAILLVSALLRAPWASVTEAALACGAVGLCGFVYTLLLAPIGVLPAFIGLGGILYLAVSAGMGFWMVLEAFATWREKDAVNEPSAKRLFGVSLIYLFVPFAALIIEHIFNLPTLWT